MTALLMIITLFCVNVTTGWSNPLHASCKVDWVWTANCEDVSGLIVSQIKKWTTDDNCASGGEKCLYKLVSATSSEIKATHETPVKHYTDDLTFTLTQDGSTCKVHGFSTSETWYAILDYGTNYCNMHNLITGAGMDKLPGYKETTSNSQCTQYTSANCDKY